MNIITQDMKYRQSLLNFAIRHGVSKASRKYNKARSFIYFWLARYDGSIESLACKSRRPHSHPNQHTPEEIKLLRDMCRRNPKLGRVELWCRLRKRGYARSLSGMYRVLRKLNLTPQKVKKRYIPKPYEQMTFPGERVQVDVKIVPKAWARQHFFGQFVKQRFSRSSYGNDSAIPLARDSQVSFGCGWCCRNRG